MMVCVSVKGVGMKKEVVAVNEYGIRLGQYHHRSKLTDHEVELIRRLHEEGLSYMQLADKFEVSKSAIAGICRYQRRAQTPCDWRTVVIDELEH
tara:strand:+ start:155639 stop:155920 length:282 start_codon:yes stop_codon:yes gene_type:complete